MNHTFLTTALFVSAAFAAPTFAAPTFAGPGFAVPSKTTLPAEVRAMLARGATSFLLKRLPVGPKGTKMLVHVWGVTRPNTPDSNNVYNEFSASPFCVDVFAPVQNSKKRWAWQLASSAAYIDENSPVEVAAHWLVPAKKQGPVLEIVSSSGAPGVSTYHKLFVWKDGFRTGYSAPTPQEFSSGGSGGGNIEQKFDEVDERGVMSVVSVNAYGGGRTVTRARWNGERFAPTSTQRFRADGKLLSGAAWP